MCRIPGPRYQVLYFSSINGSGLQGRPNVNHTDFFAQFLQADVNSFLTPLSLFLNQALHTVFAIHQLFNMVSFVNDNLNKIKIESVPDEPSPSMSDMVPKCAKFNRSEVANNVPVLPVNVQNVTFADEINEKTELASIAPGCAFQSPYLSPQDDPLFKLVQRARCARRKRKMFDASLICPRRWGELCPSDRMRLYELIQLRADALNEAVMYLNIPPFPTASEIAQLPRRTKKIGSKSSNKTAKHVPRVQKAAIQKKSTLVTGSAPVSRKKARKVVQAKQAAARGKRTSAKRCDQE